MLNPGRYIYRRNHDLERNGCDLEREGAASFFSQEMDAISRIVLSGKEGHKTGEICTKTG